ncbi:Fe-S cluster assembly protein SufD [Methylohalomonas lacus]|uniref:Fe-S cluster assembly protein SufD n=1 Tax=Methylohalomonas lacus TaxID=398773 RepID=A0AAE3HH20_9GAMM|nr:Fe-S cluster assembly protein SufD [Methylohalomonas lacus]MCS3902136.1 Fe-S cluster assembly protein SufD [Methylohalomonas lacus]
MNAVVNNPVEHFQSEYARLIGELDNDPLRDERKAALERFAATGLPTKKVEAWKYTDVQPIAKRHFNTTQAAPPIDVGQVDAVRFGDLDCHELVFVNGRFNAQLSRLGDTASGISIRSLAAALADSDSGIGARLGHCLGENTHAFTELNTAFLQDGAVIEVARGVQVDKPIVLLYLDTATDTPTACHPRTFVSLGENAAATLVESFAGLDDSSENLTNQVTEIDLADNARLDHYKIVQGGGKNFHIGSINARQARDSRLESHSLALGGNLTRTDINTRLEAEGATVILNGLYMVDGKQHVDHHTRVDHLVPHTNSVETYRGVLNGNSRAVFNGKVYVHRDAQKTDAQQSNANLLLSKTAEVDTKPELEIYADDVKCSHGATVGQLDEDALFYLRSRAIDESTAGSLLTYAFASEVVAQIKLAPIRERLEHIVLDKLPQTEQIGEFV